jgi:hypothetical protein
VADAGWVPAGDRAFIEEAVTLLVTAAPSEWMQLHGEFEPSSRPVVAAAHATTAQGRSHALAVSAEVMTVLARQQHSAAAAGAPWRRLVIDCHVDGRLSARAEGVPVDATGPVSSDPQRVPRRVLAALTAACLIAAAVVFAVGWRWFPPPRVGMIPFPPTPPRQQEAFDVLSKWYDARNHANVPGMRAVVCRDPGPTVVGWIESIEQYGQTQAYTYPEAVTSAVEDGKRLTVTISVRQHPLDAAAQQDVNKAQSKGGFESDTYVLADEGGQLKVCDGVTGDHP